MKTKYISESVENVLISVACRAVKLNHICSRKKLQQNNKKVIIIFAIVLLNNRDNIGTTVRVAVRI